MKIKIYCIIDINGLKYVGKTKQKLHKRLVGHKTNKKNNNKGCSSILLDLDNKQYSKQYYLKNKDKTIEKIKEYKLFNSKKVCNGCYEFIQMLNSY